MKEAVDRIQVGGVKLPKLKGRTTIILRDKNGKEQKRIVSENMVTNAVAKIWQNNFANTLDVRDKRLLPIKNMFGGVMCFKQTINESAGNIFPPDQGTNPLIAHAGDYASTTSVNPKLGTLDAVNSGEITNGYRWQWFFNLSQGVGRINCCCLTSAAGGNVGLTPIANETAGVVFPSVIVPSIKTIPTGINSGYDTVDSMIFNPIKFDRVNNRATSVFVDGSTFTEIISEMRLTKFGLNTAPMRHSEDEVTVSGVVKNRYAWREISRKSVSMSVTFGDAHVVVTDGTDYWVFERYTSGGSTYIRGDKITHSGNDLVVSTMPNFGNSSFGMVPYKVTIIADVKRKTSRYGFIPVRTEGDHKWAYFPTDDQTSFYKVDLNNLQDITLCPTHIPSGYLINSIQPAYWAGKILCGYNYMINNDEVYAIAIPEGAGTTGNTYYYNILAFDDTPSLLIPSKYSATNDATHLGYLTTGIHAPYLATINNLESEVEKTLSQTMSIIYELVEVQ